VVTVTNAIDEFDAYTGTPPDPPVGADGLLSLREAIVLLDAIGGGTLAFAVPAMTVTLGPLPAITVPVTIDVPLAADGTSTVVISGGGLHLGAGGSTVKGLTIDGAITEPGLTLDGPGNDIENNFLGTDPTGHVKLGNEVGLLAGPGSSGNTIKNNLVSGSLGDGIALFSSGNTVQSNKVGTDSTGKLALPNDVGVAVFGPDNTIGGKLYSEGNVISGNTHEGICLSGPGAVGNSVEGNIVGLTAPDLGSTGAEPHALANGFGVLVTAGASANFIGDTTLLVHQNVISGNTTAGVLLVGVATSANLVQGNFIGTTPDGLYARPNGIGVELLSGASHNTIGGTSVGFRNIISGNKSMGVLLNGKLTNDNVVYGNTIGADGHGSALLGNGGAGIVIRGGAQSNLIGTDGSTVAGNVIVANRGDGIDLYNSGTNKNLVAGNWIGTGADGLTPGGNKGNGVVIARGARGNTIGVSTVSEVTGSAGNVIAYNGGDGVDILDPTTMKNVVAGNWIGTGSANIAEGNTGNGVVIGNAPSNTIGGGTAGTGNVISANAKNGVVITGTATANVVQGNLIGTQSDGQSALGNSGDGVLISGGASGNFIGLKLDARGNTTGKGNTIAFNLASGVVVADTGTGDAILSNSIFANGQGSAGGLGIDLGNDGVTLNHAAVGGPLVGPNVYQNFPVLTSVVTVNGVATIHGKLIAFPKNTTFRVEFFSNPTPDAALYGEGQTYLGFARATTDDQGNAAFTKTFARASTITTTATDPAGDTSEFSSYVMGDLGIVRSNGTELSDSQDLASGGYVALNNDNDNYQVANQNGVPVPVQDKDKLGAIVGEHDLVPLVLHKVNPLAEGGMYRLVFTSPDIRIWANSDRSGQVLSDTTEFDATQDTTVYVEGYQESAGVAQDQVTLKWVGGTNVVMGDTVAFTVYAVTGALDVPGLSIYTYQADIPGGATGSWTVTKGTIKSGAQSNSARIFWSEGPVVGVATFRAPNGFNVDRDVNVVQVVVESTAGANNSLTYHNYPTQQGVGSPFIDSSVGTPASAWDLRVLKVVGPTVNGQMRGVQFIDMGFVQNGFFAKEYGDFNGFPVPHRFQGSLQDGTFHIDYLTGPPASAAPWYDSNGAGYFRSPADQEVDNQDVTSSDTPSLEGIVTSQIAPGDIASAVPGDPLSLTIGGVTSKVSRFGLVFDLNVYFALHTLEAANGSDQVYTQRASAHWEFDGSGTIQSGPTNAGTWHRTGRGNTGSAAFVEIRNGNVVPVTTGIPINTLFGAETWSTH
jgi:parallel beta-helix repeat protein